MKNLFKRLFNTNTGYFLESCVYKYEGKYYIGYFLRKGYRLFGISGHDTIDSFLDMDSVNEYLNINGIKLKS